MNGGVYEEGMTESPLRNCFAILVDNEPGVLARVIGLFAGRGYNIESLTVDEVDQASHLSRITIVTSGSPLIIDQIKSQLSRLVPVRRVINLTRQGRFLEMVAAYIKLIASADQRAKATVIAEKAGASVADISDNAVVFALTTTESQIDALINELREFGTIESARTGSVAMSCGETMLELPAS